MEATVTKCGELFTTRESKKKSGQIRHTWIRDIEHLKSVITRRLQENKNDPDLVRRVTSSVSGRIQFCMNACGGQFEQNK